MEPRCCYNSGLNKITLHCLYVACRHLSTIRSVHLNKASRWLAGEVGQVGMGHIDCNVLYASALHFEQWHREMPKNTAEMCWITIQHFHIPVKSFIHFKVLLFNTSIMLEIINHFLEKQIKLAVNSILKPGILKTDTVLVKVTVN